MDRIERNYYLNQLIEKRDYGRVIASQRLQQDCGPSFSSYLFALKLVILLRKLPVCCRGKTRVRMIL